MSNEPVNQDAKMDNASSGETANPVNQDVKTDNMIPQSRFNEAIAKEREKNAELMKQVEKFNAQKEEDRKKQLELDGKHSELIAEQKEELKRLRAFEALHKQQAEDERKDLINQLPEEHRGTYSELSNAALRKHIQISNNVSAPNTAQTKPTRAGNKENGGYNSMAEWAQKDPKGMQAYIEDTTPQYIK
ncbi:MAG: hypothetical protein Unbinned2514contig1001_26 [Prokaryotic dsDNA virus sp.]|nr:MAG: hypothetical protein Unbinned2514contig1001_26 [Prokaryotic dsDNA virus sp.]|tara:strand:- start:2202 stop:2768 length:567 start_codon:yes stop_codon:yes gene_type:complete